MKPHRDNPNTMSAKEYRDKFVKPSNPQIPPFKPQNPQNKQSMTAGEWREMMRKKKNKPSTKNVDEIRIMLQLAKIPFLEEYQFHKPRKWRFDFAIPADKVAIEYEGIHSAKSRHTTKSGFTGDTEKYNAAAADGWKVLRYTSGTYKRVIDDIQKILNDEN